jgi:hypothetical protein
MFQLKDTSNDPRRTRKPRQNGENWRRRSDQPWILLSKFAMFLGLTFWWKIHG